MESYTKAQLLSLKENTSIGLDASIKSFIRQVAQNLQDNTEDFKYIQKSDVVLQVIKFKQDNLIRIPRQIIEKKYDKNILNVTQKGESFTANQIKGLIESLLGIKIPDSSILFDLQRGSIDLGKATKIKQDFVCYAVRYFFKNTNAKAYDFINHLFFENINLSDRNLSVSITEDQVKEFLYHNNHSYLIDAIGTAQTIKKHRTKLKIKGSLVNYTVAEESSEIGNIIKQQAYDNIKRNEKNYYTAADKLTTADIFLYNVANLPSDNKNNKFRNIFELANDRNLSHDAYTKYINKALISGYIIPISLKKLESSDLTISNGNLETTKLKIINVATAKGINEQVIDPFLQKVIDLLSLSNKSEFIAQMEEVIDIKNETISLNMYGTRSTFDFDAKFKVGKNETYDVFIQTNQIYIKPPGSSSNSGLGGISLEYIKEQIMANLPERAKFFNALKKIRSEAFGQSFNYEFDLVNQTIGSLNKSAAKLIEIAKAYKVYNRKYIKEANFRNAIVNSVTIKNPKDNAKRRDEIRSEISRKNFDQLTEYLVDKKVNWSPAVIAEDIKNTRIIRKYSQSPILKHSKILSPSEYKMVFDRITTNKDEVAIKYVRSMQDNVENIVRRVNLRNDRFMEEMFAKKGIPLTPSERSDLIYNKLSTMEFLYYIGSNQATVRKWIKNALILGIYGISSASGVIILNGNHFTKNAKGEFQLKRGGKSAITRRNPMYVKIGL